jgi:hypothetical protein
VNTTDKIVTALTPGSIFNRNGLVFRSAKSLAEFSGITEDEVLATLNGDLAVLVTCKPSKKGKGILVALTAIHEAQQQAEAMAADVPVVVVAVPVGPGAPIIEVEEVAADGPLDEAPVD